MTNLFTKIGKIVLSAVCLLAFTYASYAQDVKDELGRANELSYNNGVWQSGARLSPGQVRLIMSEDMAALRQYNSGRSLSMVGQVITYPCAFLLGFDLGTRLAGGEGSGAVLGIGAAGMVVGIVIAISGEKKIKNSVQLYNSRANNTVAYRLSFGPAQDGIGLSMRF